MKKVLYITKNFPPQVGGGLRRIEAVYQLLTGHPQIDLTVITAVKTDNKKYPDVKTIHQHFFKDKVITVNKSFKQNQSKIKFLDKALLGWVPFILLFLLFKKKYDYVIATCPTFSTCIAAYLYKILKWNRPRLIIEYRDFFSFNPGYIDDKNKAKIRKLEKKIIQKCDSIIVTTRSMKKIISQYIDEKKIRVIRNYISNQDLKNAEKLEKFQLDPNFFHIGYIGKLNTGRNPDKILEITKLKIEDKPVALHFVGVNEQLQKLLLQIAKDSSINENALFFVPEVSRLSSLQYMRSFDGVFLIVNSKVSIKEGYGIPGKIYDYLALNNHIFCDKDTFQEMQIEFDCKIQNQYPGYIDFTIEQRETLDGVFNQFIETAIL